MEPSKKIELLIDSFEAIENSIVKFSDNVANQRKIVESTNDNIVSSIKSLNVDSFQELLENLRIFKNSFLKYNKTFDKNADDAIKLYSFLDDKVKEINENIVSKMETINTLTSSFNSSYNVNDQLDQLIDIISDYIENRDELIKNVINKTVNEIKKSTYELIENIRYSGSISNVKAYFIENIDKYESGEYTGTVHDWITINNRDIVVMKLKGRNEYISFSLSGDIGNYRLRLLIESSGVSQEVIISKFLDDLCLKDKEINFYIFKVKKMNVITFDEDKYIEKIN